MYVYMYMNICAYYYMCVLIPQHQRKPSERHRPSSFDTAVFILQKDKAFKSEALLTKPLCY